ncbi:Arylsulfotransferase [Corynebacterium maris DSM 45190]|uniref:Arylsulfotransferase n=1 Tax=Corynebacterium maris DSM 45190 TaxID=1224163 RepID=S5SRG1_9CORY|nr:Arylsulfotransferase [Corynebacterium maris DSM 45190]
MHSARPLFRTLTAGAAVTALLATSACSFGPDHENSSLADGPDVQPSPVFEGEHTDFVTRPDLADFPTQLTEGEAYQDRLEGYIPASPRIEENPPAEQPIGNVIVDTDANTVWLQNRDHLNPEHDTTYNLHFQQYQGEPVLTWWEGATHAGWGFGEIVIADASYEEIARIAPTEGIVDVEPDFHEFRLTDNDTLLTLYYQPTQTDLTAVGGPVDGWVMDGVFQEYDVETGELLFEWSALDHVPVTASMWDYPVEIDRDPNVGTELLPFDYFHINSVHYDADDTDTFLISARNTHAVYSVDRDTGELNWTLGGRYSDYDMGEDGYFGWQHDVQRAEDGTIQIFDNASEPAMRENSRVINFELDDDDMVAHLVRQLDPPEQRRADYMANAEATDSGHVMVGWGYEPFFTQYTPDGEVTIDVDHSPYINYRSYISEDWTGTPQEAPALAVEGDSVFVSWNGATEVAQWRLFSGADEENTEFREVADWDGFETELSAPNDDYIAVQALDDNGDVLAASYIDAATS